MLIEETGEPCNDDMSCMRGSGTVTESICLTLPTLMILDFMRAQVLHEDVDLGIVRPAVHPRLLRRERAAVLEHVVDDARVRNVLDLALVKARHKVHNFAWCLYWSWLLRSPR